MIAPAELAETIASYLRDLDTIGSAEVTVQEGSISNRAEIRVETQGGTELYIGVGLSP